MKNFTLYGTTLNMLRLLLPPITAVIPTNSGVSVSSCASYFNGDRLLYIRDNDNSSILCELTTSVRVAKRLNIYMYIYIYGATVA